VVAGEDPSNLDILFEGFGHRKIARSFKGLVEVADESVPSDHPFRKDEHWPKADRDGKRAEATRALSTGFGPFLAEFLASFPGGLRSQECDAQERTYKVQAGEYASKELSPEVLEGLLGRGEYAEIMQRTRRSLAKVNLVYPNELMKFGDIPASAHKDVAERIVRLVTAGDRTPAVLEDLAAVLKPHDAAKWTIVSLLPFLLHPERWPFVKPTFIQRAEKALHIDVEYEPRPNARTYELIRDLYAQVFSLLAQRGQAPRDFIDVQTFLWVASGMKREMDKTPSEPAA
jgi:hypothetical protein